MTSMKIWTQENGIEIEEVEFDGDAHAFKIYVDDRYVLTIYAGTAEVTEDIKECLDAGDDVRDFVDDDGNSVGTLIYENCPLKTIIEDWDDDYGDIIAFLCENCPDRDECSERDY